MAEILIKNSSFFGRFEDINRTYSMLNNAKDIELNPIKTKNVSIRIE
jgi:hypothetical protein